MKTSAEISHDGRYRYRLTREWEWGGRPCVFIMLNPSTADAETDDATIRRCISYAKSFGCGRLDVVNLYSYRATEPADLWRFVDAHGVDVAVGGIDAVSHIHQAIMQKTALVICGWGEHGAKHRTGHKMRMMLERSGVQPFYLRLTKSGEPAHPLYLPRDLAPIAWGGFL